MKLELRQWVYYCSAVLLVLVASLIWSAYVTPQATGSAPTGYSAVNGTTSAITMTDATDVSELFATSTCVSRVITTGTKNIRLKFFDSAFALSATAGHLQTASTTVAYDSGIYGCGLVTGLSTDADTVRVSELRDFR